MNPGNYWSEHVSGDEAAVRYLVPDPDDPNKYLAVTAYVPYSERSLARAPYVAPPFPNPAGRGKVRLRVAGVTGDNGDLDAIAAILTLASQGPLWRALTEAGRLHQEQGPT